MKRICLIVGVLLAGCATAPISPMQIRLNKQAVMRVLATECPAYSGGYLAVKEINKDADTHLQKAIELGATDKDIEDANAKSRMEFDLVQIIAGKMKACNAGMSTAATGQ